MARNDPLTGAVKPATDSLAAIRRQTGKKKRNPNPLRVSGPWSLVLGALTLASLHATLRFVGSVLPQSKLLLSKPICFMMYEI